MIILPSNSSGEYEVANSLRFNESDDCLIKTFGSGGNRKKWTFSVWFKRGKLGGSYALFVAGTSGNDEATIRIESDKIDWQHYDDGTSSTDAQLLTSQVLRDPSAWYNLQCVYDSANSTAGDRMKMFLNGSEITSFSTDNNPSLNYDSAINNNVLHNIGRQSWNNSADFSGYMAEICFIDGQALTPTSFGEFDEDTGIWKPIDVSGLTFGTNGFYLDFEDSSALGNDVSGNDNDFTVNNLTSIDQTTDTCTNNFATLNPLAKGANVTLTEGNLQFTSNNRYGTVGTFGLSSGKWYWEVKVVDAGSDIQVGIFQGGGNIGYPNAELGKTSQGWSVISIGGNRLHNLSQSSYGGAAFSDGDILMVALDMDNGKWYMGKNNSWFDSGNPATSSSPAHTGITGTIFPAIATYAESESGSINYQFNFGSPPYAISSGNTDGNGYGNFEYAVPSGYYALNTKNLAEYG